MKSLTLRTSFSSFLFLGVVALAGAVSACGGDADGTPSPTGGGDRDGGVTHPSSQKLAYCTELTVNADGATVTSMGIEGTATDHLSKGDLVLRRFTKGPFFDKYEVDYLDAEGAIQRGEISKNDVIDRCPSTASTAYYVTDATEFVSDLTEHPPTACTLAQTQVLRPREYTFDTRVSRTHAKMVLADALPECAITTGFVPIDRTAFVVAYESDTPAAPILTPTRKR